MVTIKKMRELREKMGLTQTQFAKKLNVSQCQVNRWEKGKANPRYETLKLIFRMAEAQGIKFVIA